MPRCGSDKAAPIGAMSAARNGRRHEPNRLSLPPGEMAAPDFQPCPARWIPERATPQHIPVLAPRRKRVVEYVGFCSSDRHSVTRIPDFLVEVLLVYWGKDDLEHFRIRHTLRLKTEPFGIGSPGFRVHLWVIQRQGQLHIVPIQTPPPLFDTHFFAERHAPFVAPESRIQPGGFDNEGIAFPSADGISVKSWPGIFRHLSAVRPDFTPNAEPFEKLDHLVLAMNELKRPRIDQSAQ